MITDAQYVEFLQRLGADQRGANPLTLGEFEQSFIGSFIGAQRQSLWLTEKRRGVTDKMWRKHGPDLGFPHPLDTVTERPAIAPADPAGCEYLVKDDETQRQRRCNEPAVCRESKQMGTKGLRYCETHKTAVQRAFPKIVLIAIEPQRHRDTET